MPVAVIIAQPLIQTHSGVGNRAFTTGAYPLYVSPMYSEPVYLHVNTNCMFPINAFLYVHFLSDLYIHIRVHVLHIYMCPCFWPSSNYTCLSDSIPANAAAL